MMHSTKLFNKFFYAVTIVAFIFQLIMPTTVYADGEDPTPEPAPTSIPVDEATPAPTEEITPLPTDLVIPEGTDLVVLDENGQPLPLATQAAAEVLVLGDPIWCPVGATPVALTNGCTDSYTSLTALLAEADESLWGNGVIWIEDGAITEAGAVSLNGASNTNSLTINGGWTGGTTLDAATPSTFVKPITIFWGGALTINNLTLDGTTAGNVEAMLVINSTAADPNASTSAVTLSNVTVTNSQGTPGTVNADAEVSFATGEAGYGAKINTTAGGVTVSDSTFSYNNHSGLTITSAGPVTLNSVTAHGNGGQRDLTSGEITAVEAAHANLDNLDANGDVIDSDTYYKHVWWGSGVDVLASAGDVLVQNSQFGLNTNAERNNDNGLIVEATSGNITLDGVTANGNFNSGADLTANEGTIQVTDSYFLNTREYSNSVYVAGPGCTGPYDLCGWYDGADYWNDATTADWYWAVVGYGGTGLFANGSSDITLTRVNAATPGDGNDVFGAQLFSWGGDIAIEDSEFNSNSYTGLIAISGAYWDEGTSKYITGCYDDNGIALNGGCDITLTNVYVSENNDGASLSAEAGGITVQKNANGSSKFRLNDGTGLYAEAGNLVGCPAGAVCDVTLTDVTLEENGDSGAEVGTYNGDLTITNMTATDNGGSGLYFEQVNSDFTGSLFVTGTNEFSQNGDIGLEASIDHGNVTLTGGNFIENDNGLYIWVETGDVTLTGGTFDENFDTGLHIETGIGNISLTNIEGNDNTDGYGAELYTDEGGNVTVSNSHFNSNSTGVYVETAQYETCNSGLTCNITLTNIEGNDNTDGYGAELYTDASGNISVSNSFFNSNSRTGLNATSSYSGCDSGPCNVTITNIIANDNDRGGADLNTNYGGSITVNGGTFNGNKWDGLYLATAIDDCLPGMVCDITMNGVTAQNNGWEGANLGTEMGGKITVNGGTFTNNEYGLSAEVNEDNETNLSGAVKFDSVTATGNLYSGASITLYKNGGTVEVTNSVFNLNGNNGLFVDSYSLGTAAIPEIFLNGVTANQNAAKGFFYYGPTPTWNKEDPTPANILICSGSYSDNTGYGINIDNFGGTTTFGGSVVSIGNNLTGEVPGENWLNPEAALDGCVKVSLGGGERTKAKPKTYEYFSETVNSQEKAFICDSYLGLVIYTEELKDEDHVMIPCGSKGTGTHASAFKTLENELPVKPAVGTFVSALKLSIEDNENASAIHTGQWMVSFKLPEGAKTSEYSIMFWNGISWELVPNTFTVDGYFQSWVNMLGYYMLIKN